MKLVPTMMNRTGATRAPDLAAMMNEATIEFPPSSTGGLAGIATMRAEYVRTAPPFATMPPPAGVGQMAKDALQRMLGAEPTSLLDKLGERLAFECSGTRLYDAVLVKHDAGRNFTGGPRDDELMHIRDEERAHFLLLVEAITELGGDPTAITPSANLHATISMGLPHVLTDPRTDVAQCLEALLVAELADNECWTTLVDLTERAAHTELAGRFRMALAHEREHLDMVRGWLAVAMNRPIEAARGNGAPMRDRSGASADSAQPSGKNSKSRSRQKRSQTGRSAAGRGKRTRAR